MKNVQTLRRALGLTAVVALIGLAAASCDSAAAATTNISVPVGCGYDGCECGDCEGAGCECEDSAGAIYHTVSFHTDGSGVPSAQVRHGRLVTEPGQNPTRGSYVFAGWHTAASGGTAFDFGAPITGNTTVYARWNAPDPTLEATISAGITLEMRWIPAGAFTMGQAAVAPNIGGDGARGHADLRLLHGHTPGDAGAVLRGDGLQPQPFLQQSRRWRGAGKAACGNGELVPCDSVRQQAEHHAGA